MQVGKGEGGIPHLKTYLYILSIFLNVLLCMVCVHECVRACVSFYLCVSSRDETRATRLEGQVPLPFEPELPCLPFHHCHGHC